MNLTELRLSATRTYSLYELLDFYVKNLKDIKSNGLEYLYSSLIDELLRKEPLLEQSKLRLEGLRYINAYSPSFNDFQFSYPNKTKGVFRHGDLYFIRENWAYSVVSPSELSSEKNPYASQTCMIAESLGIRRLLYLLSEMCKIQHSILKGDTYLVVRPTDLDAILDVFDFNQLKNSYFICRFLNYNQTYASLMETLLPIRNISFPQSIVSSILTQPSKNFIQVLDSANMDIRDTLFSRNKKASDFCNAYYNDSFHLTLPEKIKNHNLKVMLLTSKSTTALQYFIRDMEKGFQEVGCKTLTLKEGEYEATGIRPDVAISTIAEFKPDIIFQIDYCRYHSHVTPSNIPFVFWIQDFMMPNISQNAHIEKFTDKDVTISLCSLSQFKHMKYKNVEYFPVPVNTDLFYGDPENTEYDCDLAMINHFSVPKLEMLINNEDYTDRILNIISPIIKKDLHKLMTREDYAKELNSLFPDILINPNGGLLLDNVMITLGNSLVRKTFVEWVAALGHNFHLYGNDWDTIPEIKSYALGALPNGKTSSRVYNRSKINFHVHPWVTVHPRVFESIASGGFMLIKRIGSRDMAPINEILPEGEGYIFFNDRKDFEKKVRYYLTHDDERREIIRKGHATVMSKFTVGPRAQYLLDILSRRFS